MKAEELSPKDLRIGNILIEKYTGHILVVSDLTKNRITFDYQTLEKWQAIPIPLSEEVLLKCGFEKDKDSPWLLWNGMLVLNTGNHNTWQYGQSVIKDIKYLHTLQNVFFALHQRELEVKWS